MPLTIFQLKIIIIQRGSTLIFDNLILYSHNTVGTIIKISNTLYRNVVSVVHHTKMLVVLHFTYNRALSSYAGGFPFIPRSKFPNDLRLDHFASVLHGICSPQLMIKSTRFSNPGRKKITQIIFNAWVNAERHTFHIMHSWYLIYMRINSEIVSRLFYYGMVYN